MLVYVRVCASTYECGYVGMCMWKLEINVERLSRLLSSILGLELRDLPALLGTASLGDPLVSPSPARELDVCRCARLSVWFLGMQTRGLGLVQQELGGRGISEALP